MTTTYVAIDLETTGLDPTRDAIIEVAVVTFRGNDIIDEFAALVNPLRDIPPYVSQLTGITDAMVADAPSLFSLRSRLRSKLADHVIVGHNVEFDLGFLREPGWPSAVHASTRSPWRRSSCRRRAAITWARWPSF